MGEDLLDYIHRLELIGFFSGFPIVYALILFFAGERKDIQDSFFYRLVRAVPYGYALTGSLYIGMILKNLFIDPSYFDNATVLTVLLQVWAALSLVFWFPPFSRKPLLSLVHSLVIFAVLVAIILLAAYFGNDMLRNAMKLYTDSLLLNSITVLLMVALNYIYRFVKRTLQSSNK